MTYITGDVADAVESPVYAILQMNRVLSSMPRPDGYGLESLNTQLPFDSSKVSLG